MSTRPKNVIILTADEMRADCAGFMGNTDIQTPCLDRLSRRGIVFENHFAVHGKCVPSRIAMVTGRYCHTDGYRTITQLLPDDQPNLLHKLRSLGYESAVFGHNHVWENFWGGNRKSGGCCDYHSYTDGYFRPMLDKQWPVPLPGPASAQPMDLPPRRFDYAGRIEQPLTGFCDDNRAEQAIHYLASVRDRSRPFYLHVNLSQPHPPYRVEEPYFSMYGRQAIRAWPHSLPDGAPLALRQMRQFRTGPAEQARVFREIQAVYYAMISKADALMGRILETIERQGLFDDSIVLFTSDHGDFAGQYGLVEKWDTSMADCILRVPHILCAPGLPQGQRVAGLTEHTDILPTILQLLGIEPDWGIHGQSLLPAIAGQARKPAVFADGGHEDEMLGRFSFRPEGKESGPHPLDGKQLTYQQCPDTMARTKMVRTERWKLVIRLRGGNELYDLQSDPWEMKNLWGDPDLTPIVLDLQQPLIEWCLRTDTDRPRQGQVGA